MNEKYAHIGADDPANRVIEEASELILAIAKAKRFGWFSWWHPHPLNYQAVLNEIQDCEKQFALLRVYIQKMVDAKNAEETVEFVGNLIN